MVDSLLDLSADALFALQLEGGANTSACVDGTIVTRPAPAAIRVRGAAGVPLITGCCKDEGSFLAPVMDTGPGALEAVTVVFALIAGNGDAARYLKLLDSLLRGATALMRMERAWYDFFRASVLRASEAATEAAVGGWVFNFDAPTDNPLGVTHGSEIPFTFNSFKDGEVSIGFHDGKDPVNRELAEWWSTTFAAFARTGDPNGAGLPEWPRYDANTRSCLVLDRPPRIASDPDGPEARSAYGMD